MITALVACGEDSKSSTDSMDPSDPSDPSDPESMTSNECNAQVVIEFFTDVDCTVSVSAAEPTRAYDTTQSCFSWEGNSAAGANAATNFQCCRDRVCYTQHPGTLECDNPRPTNKEALTDECVLDTQNPNGRAIYAKIISGTESCPEAPPGFECPLSAPGEGTQGIAACTTEP